MFHSLKGKGMELTLLRPNQTSEVSVLVDDDVSHTLDLTTLLPTEPTLDQTYVLIADPQAYGQALFSALFPTGSLTASRLADSPERLLLVTEDEVLQSIPWEFLYSPDGFLVCDLHFVRGLPADQRTSVPDLDNTPLHVLAIPSNPLHEDVRPLNIDGEWERLVEIIAKSEKAITLERVRPPTLAQLRQQIANQQHRVLHFMGHGGQDEEHGAVLLFENEFGDLRRVFARDFTRRVRRTAFLVTLNACVSATPGETEFSNLAFALMKRQIPYALGMRFSVLDEDARRLSRVLYSELAQGTSVEEAIYQARLDLADSDRSWAVGVPVLYTSLAAPAAGFTANTGSADIQDPQQPEIEVIGLPRTDGTFQGRSREMLAIGQYLTGDERPRLLTIHGGGGQGKTALAREVAERFAYAFPGGVWAVSFESLPTRQGFVTALARFLNIPLDEFPDPTSLEAYLLRLLSQRRRMLVILDNVETLVEAVDKDDEAVIDLAQFLRQQLSQPTITLLATSRRFLDWPGEEVVELPGLKPAEGAALFREHTSRRADTFTIEQAAALSRKVGDIRSVCVCWRGLTMRVFTPLSTL